MGRGCGSQGTSNEELQEAIGQSTEDDCAGNEKGQRGQ
jgi:hypothetical protein